MKVRTVLFFGLAILMGGCLPVFSLHGLYSEDSLVLEEKLLGRWTTDPNEPDDLWQFARADDMDKTYKLTMCDSDKNKGCFLARLVKLDSRYFLDLYPDKDATEIKDPNKVDWPYNYIFMVPTHTFLKVESIVPRIKLKLTEDQRLQQLLDEEPNAIGYVKVEDRILLTAETKELQAFVLKYADDERLFPDEIVLYPKTK